MGMPLQSQATAVTSPAAQSDRDIIMKIEDLRTYFYTDYGVVKAVDGVSIEFKRGKVVGVVGESGCGKSVTALSTMQLVSQPPGKIVGGNIIYYPEQGSPVNIAQLRPNSRQMRQLRGKELAMIFQEPMTSLTPVYTIGDQICEKLLTHEKMTKKEAMEFAIEMLDKVGIPDPALRVKEDPHQMSGGMRQRAVIAIALCCNPSFLIADEPTTALDVTIQAQILTLLEDLQSEFNSTIMLITHDLGVVGEMADEVVVMYTGKVVEKADVRTIFRRPRHPYTQGLFRSIPLIGMRGKSKLTPIAGALPDPYDLPSGCLFEPRCPHAMDRCKTEPPTVTIDDGHDVKCWLYTVR